MWVKSLPHQPQVTGRYGLVDGRSASGQPVWRQEGGPGWLYSSTEGVWFVTVHEFCVGKTGGIIGCLEEHKGSPPQDMKSWKRWGGPNDGWTPDESVAVTGDAEVGAQWETAKAQQLELRFADVPQAFTLTSPGAHSALAGKYHIVAGQTSNSQPLWRQDGGSGWLYADSFGFWRFTDDEAKISEAGSVIQSADILAPSQWPHEIKEWKRDGGGCGCDGGDNKAEWELDTQISVSA